jgi:hypothetical protein
LRQDRSWSARGWNGMRPGHGMIGFSGTRARTGRHEAADDIENMPMVCRFRIAPPGDMSIRANQDIVRAVEVANRCFAAEVDNLQGKVAASRCLGKASPDSTARRKTEQHKTAAEQIERRSTVLQPGVRRAMAGASALNVV